MLLELSYKNTFFSQIFSPVVHYTIYIVNVLTFIDDFII